MQIKAIYLVFIVSILLLNPVGFNAQDEGVITIRLSYKVVLNPSDGTRPPGVTNVAINAAVNEMNNMMRDHWRGYRFQLVEVLDIGGQSKPPITGPSYWYDKNFNEGNNRTLMATAAMNDPITYQWSNSAVNLYFTNGACGGIASFPGDSANIIIAGGCYAGSSNGVIHEIGHYFNLSHTFGACDTNITSRFNATGPLAIPDNNPAGAELPVTVNSIPSSINKITVSLHLLHTYSGDLRLQLIGPDGTTVNLANNLGGSGDNYGTACTPDDQRTLFDDAAAIKISDGVAPFIGSFKPEQALSAFNGKSGAAVNGTWKLRVVDSVTNDTGSIECVSLFISFCDPDGGDASSCDDGIADTLPERHCWSQNRIATNAFNRNYNQLTSAEQNLVDDVYRNIMSYHENLNKVRLTELQLDRWAEAANVDRVAVRTGKAIFAQSNAPPGGSGSPNSPYNTITAAVAGAASDSAPDIIILRPGAFNQTLTISTPVTLRATRQGAVVIGSPNAP